MEDFTCNFKSPANNAPKHLSIAGGQVTSNGTVVGNHRQNLCADYKAVDYENMTSRLEGHRRTQNHGSISTEFNRRALPVFLSVGLPDESDVSAKPEILYALVPGQLELSLRLAAEAA